MNFETSKTLLNINRTDIEKNLNNSEINNIEKSSSSKNRISKIIGKVKLNGLNKDPENKEVTDNKKIITNNSDKYLLTENRNNPINLKTYTDNFFKIGKYNSSKKKMTLIKKPQINDINNNNSFKKNTREEIFQTEIKQKITNSKEESKKSDFSTTFTEFLNKQRNSISLRNNNLLLENKTKKENPLSIPKEDMIFEEIKNYKCFKHFTKESLSKTSVPFIYINMNMNTTKKIPPKKKQNENPYQINFNNNIKKFIEFDDVFLNKNNQIFFTDEKKKNILDNVYRVPTAEDMYDKINLIKLKKDRKKLKNYQYNFLKVVKHNITDKYYEDLKEKFSEIRKIAEGKYKNNSRFIKEFEKNEEKVIKNINRDYESFMKYARRKSIRNILGKSKKTRINLPQIKFEKVINVDNLSLLKNKMNRKSNFISLSESKGMNRTSIKFKKKSFLKLNNFSSNKNIMASTSSNRFSKFKSYKKNL